jgi:thymidylate synthase (FAD)
MTQFEYIPSEPVRDIMGGSARIQASVHEHGFIALVDVMPRLAPIGSSADFAIVQAARTSYGKGTKTPSDDRGLVRYLMRHAHTTPLEMVEFKFHMRMPIFIARQWIRHRTANVNEYSARYSVVPDRFYRPDSVRQQAKSNKQSSDGAVEVGTAEAFMDYLDKAEAQYALYEKLVASGVGREIARIGLPVSAYTEWYWKCDLHNTLRFLSLRMDAHAQQEIRDFANPMYELVKLMCPIAVEAFDDYDHRRNGMSLSALEVQALAAGADQVAGMSDREVSEFAAKRTRLSTPPPPRLRTWVVWLQGTEQEEDKGETARWIKAVSWEAVAAFLRDASFVRKDGSVRETTSSIDLVYGGDDFDFIDGVDVILLENEVRIRPDCGVVFHNLAPATKVRAFLVSDDDRYSAEFDARAWLAAAEPSDILALAACPASFGRTGWTDGSGPHEVWGGDYAAGAALDGATGVNRHLEFVLATIKDSGKGYKAYINAADARVWLAANRANVCALLPPPA